MLVSHLNRRFCGLPAATGVAFTFAVMSGGCGGGASSSSSSSSLVPIASGAGAASDAGAVATSEVSPPAAASTEMPDTVSASRSKQLRVTCVGDSITFGSGTSNPAKCAYPVVLGKSLGKKYQVSNYGSPGSTMTIAGAVWPYSAYQRLPIYRAALASKPDIVIVELGTNDAALSVDKARQALFVKDYGKFLADFRYKAPEARLYMCIPPAAYGPSLFRAQNIQTTIAPLIRKVAAQNGATVIDLFTVTSPHPELFPDSLHPNDEGARKLAAEIKRVLLLS